MLMIVYCLHFSADEVNVHSKGVALITYMLFIYYEGKMLQITDVHSSHIIVNQ